MRAMIQPSRPWEWRTGETAATFDQWLTQAAEPRHFDHAEEAIQKSWLLTWLIDNGDVLAAEQVRLAKSRPQLLDRTKGEGIAPIDLSVDAHLEELLTIGSDLYTSNVFRLTGLPVIASARDIARHMEKLKVQEKLGTKGSRPSGPLPIEPPPDIDTVRTAVQSLTKDPELRILHEFFWFWPTQGPAGDKPQQDDTALRALGSGDLEKAVLHWEKIGTQSGEGPIARHNLAILFHTAALDLERASLQRPLSKEQQQQRDAYWERSLVLWKSIADEEAQWSRLSARIRALANPSLTTGYTRRLRTYLPVLLSSVNGCLAARAAESGLSEEADRHIRLLVRLGSDTQALNAAVTRIAGRYRDRLRGCCKQAEDLRAADPLQGLRAAEILLEQATPLLQAIDAMTYSGSSTREAAHDHVALTAFECVTVYENRTQRFAATIPLFERALASARGESARKKIADEMKVSKECLESGDIWCEEGYFDLPQPTLAVLEQARALANTGQYDQAISLLIEILCGRHEPAILPDQERIVRKPLAWCLNRRSVKRVNDAMAQQDIELEIIKNIRQRAANPTRGFNYSFAAAQQDSDHGLPYLVCMACGEPIEQRYYILTYKFNETDAKALICPTCNTKYDEERNRRRVAFKKVLHESAQDIQLAVELDNTNQTAKKNIADLKKLASSHQVPWPSSQKLRFQLGLITRARWLKRLAIAASVLIVSVGIFVGYTFKKSSEGDLPAAIQLHKWHLLDESTTLERIEEAARSADPTTRLHVVEARKLLADKRAVIVPALILAQLDESRKMVSAASRAIANMATAYEQKLVALAIPGLIKAAATGPVGVRSKALTLLGMIGPHENHPVIATLIDSLRDPDKDVREAAVGALQQIGAGAKQAVPTLLQLLDHEDWDTRIMAAKTMAAMGEEGKAATPILKSMLSQLPPKSPHRHALADVLASMADPSGSKAKPKSMGNRKIDRASKELTRPN